MSLCSCQSGYESIKLNVECVPLVVCLKDNYFIKSIAFMLECEVMREGGVKDSIIG